MSVSLAPQILAIIFNARNTDSTRIRPFFRSLFGLSPMNADMSVFMAPQVRPEVRHRYAQIETPFRAPSGRGQCS